MLDSESWEIGRLESFLCHGGLSFYIDTLLSIFVLARQLPLLPGFCACDRGPKNRPQGVAMVVGETCVWNNLDIGCSSSCWLRDVGQVTFSSLNPSADILHVCYED